MKIYIISKSQLYSYNHNWKFKQMTQIQLYSELKIRFSLSCFLEGISYPQSYNNGTNKSCGFQTHFEHFYWQFDRDWPFQAHHYKWVLVIGIFPIGTDRIDRILDVEGRGFLFHMVKNATRKVNQYNISVKFSSRNGDVLEIPYDAFLSKMKSLRFLTKCFRNAHCGPIYCIWCPMNLFHRHCQYFRGNRQVAFSNSPKDKNSLFLCKILLYITAIINY